MGRMQLLERNYHKGVAVERTFVVHRIHESIRLLLGSLLFDVPYFIKLHEFFHKTLNSSQSSSRSSPSYP
jgi:hypothetical protein